MARKATVVFRMQNWPEFTEPHGRLVKDAGCQALWYYNVLALQGWSRENHELVLEGEQDPEMDYEKIFRRCAQMYGADINTMANYWLLVDKEMDRQNVERVLAKGGHAMNKLPEKFRFRNMKVDLDAERKKLN